MKTTFTVTLDDKSLQLKLSNQAELFILEQNNARFKLSEEQIFLLFKKGQVQQIGQSINQIGKIEFDRVLLIRPSDFDLEKEQLASHLANMALEAGIKLKKAPEAMKLPKNLYNASAKAADEIFSVCQPFDLHLEKKKAVSPKAQHRWKKAISTIEFEIRHEGCAGQVIWEKSTQLRLKAGAMLLPDDQVPLRKDGSLSFTGKFATGLREDHANSIDKKHWTTTEDILLRSVNELGHLVYFAGTNSWLELFDAEGRTIHELTVV
ncbi:hypothetical protein [Lactococcus termiticola]|uniref:Uncharacterized protein n=1 Tax=Lactococcus termiticola TaxID=2169526 RepID=A0A2R5HIF5_9LACT|nr:hypothetical protein [Lactococcus termiticola]GBG96098.1 hypothetical protein NtB2_00202 [Lactococcus termiticola]